MNWLKRNPFLGAVLLSCALALGAEAWTLQRAGQRATRALAALEQKKQERDWLARQSPAPSEVNEQAISEDLAQTGRGLMELRAALWGSGPNIPVTSSSAKPIDVFFDLAAFVEKTRAAAARARVTIKPGERFGFAAHANEGPGAELVPAVFRQRNLMESLLAALFESHPRELLGVQRERPMAEAQPGQNGGTETRDFFDLSPFNPLRVPGRVESQGFRVEFSGQTPALRAFLNNLAALPQPAVVRSVEVEPLAGAQSVADGAAETVPLVADNFSRFTVVVEFVELASTGAGHALPEPLPPGAKPWVWSQPAPQVRGSGWLYELFTPPVIHYDPSVRSFTVMPPMNAADGGPPSGLELLEVKIEPFRLQLVGYYGEPGDYRAAFVSPGQPETLLARRGRRFEQLGLTLKSIDVRKVVVAHTDAWPVHEVAAFAVLSDDKSGEEVVLDSRARKFTGMPLAVLRLPAAGGPVHTLHEGDIFADGIALCSIEHIQLDPPEVVVVRKTPGLPRPETKILRLADSANGQFTAKAAEPKGFPVPSETSVATNGN